MLLRCAVCSLSLFAFSIALCEQASADLLYYTEPGFDDGIRQLNKDGTGHAFSINMGNVDPRGLAVDSLNSKFYYARGSNIYRVNFDGTSDEFLFASGGSVPTDVEIDLTGGKVYWSVSGSVSGGIRRGNLDGTGAIDLLVNQAILDPLYLLVGTPLDPAVRADDVTGFELSGGRVYWASGKGLNSMPLGGVALPTDPANQFSLAAGNEINKIALDASTGTAYWTNSVASKVQKASLLDGSGLVTLSDRTFGRPSGIALDPAGGKVFWGDTLGTNGRGEILTVNTDGSTPVASPNIIFDFGNFAYDPFDLEFGTIPEPSTALLTCFALLFGMTRRRFSQ